MTREARRLTLTVGVTALVVVGVGAALAPSPLAAPREKTDFTISTKEELVMGGTTGTFTAQGVIRDSGDAGSTDDGLFVLLEGANGNMHVSIVYDPSEPGTSKRTGTFVIDAATDQYVDLVGISGAYSESLSGHPSKDPLAASAAGRHRTAPTCWISRKMTGSTDQ